MEQKIKHLGLLYFPNKLVNLQTFPASKMLAKISSALLTIYCLKTNFGFSSNWKIIRVNGKPYISNSKNMFFNVSHTTNAVACAISKTDIGVDIEQIRPVNLSLAYKICTKTELKYFDKLNTKQKHKFLIKLWTAKESFSKMNASSIFDSLNRINFDCRELENLKTWQFKNFFISCCTKTKSEIQIYKIGLKTLLQFFKTTTFANNFNEFDL